MRSKRLKERKRSKKRLSVVGSVVLALACPSCVSDRSAAANEVDAQQRVHGWMEALPMPPAPAAAGAPSARDPLLGILFGRWEVTGRIEGKPATLLMVNGWKPDGTTLNVNLLSLARAANGQPVFLVAAEISLDPDGKHYSAVWHESVGGVGRELTGKAEKEDDRDRIGFTLKAADGSGSNPWIELDASDDTWTLYIDDVRNGWTERFASLSLRRTAPPVAP